MQHSMACHEGDDFASAAAAAAAAVALGATAIATNALATSTSACASACAADLAARASPPLLGELLRKRCSGDPGRQLCSGDADRPSPSRPPPLRSLRSPRSPRSLLSVRRAELLSVRRAETARPRRSAAAARSLGESMPGCRRGSPSSGGEPAAGDADVSEPG